MATAPISPRSNAGVVWTGKEMLVWGGTDCSGRLFDDPPPPDTPELVAKRRGALFNPATNSWRLTAPAPRGACGNVDYGAAWTGDSAFFWTSTGVDGPTGSWLYTPSTDTWKTLPPGPLSDREGQATVWTGTEQFIIGGASGDGYSSPSAAAINPRTGEWRLLKALNNVRGLAPGGALWDGREVFIDGIQAHCAELSSNCQDLSPIFLAYDPAKDAVRTLPVRPEYAGGVIAWTGTEALAMRVGRADRTQEQDYIPSFYRASDGRWRKGVVQHCGVPGPPQDDFSGGQSILAGREYITACGRDRVAIYDYAHDSWRAIQAGESGFNLYTASEMAWTGKQLIVWSGLTYPGNPSYEAGAMLTLS